MGKGENILTTLNIFFLSNHNGNFNQTSHKTSFGERNSGYNIKDHVLFQLNEDIENTLNYRWLVKSCEPLSLFQQYLVENIFGDKFV